MEEIEQLVWEAWVRVRQRVMGMPGEVERRRARMRAKTLSRPPREWCVAIRACDHRLGGGSSEHQVPNLERAPNSHCENNRSLTNIIRDSSTSAD
jgi:hypothetical protein